MERCVVCNDILVEENPGKCRICNGKFDSYCGKLDSYWQSGETREGLCDICKKKCLDELFKGTLKE